MYFEARNDDHQPPSQPLSLPHLILARVEGREREASDFAYGAKIDLVFLFLLLFLLLPQTDERRN